MNTTLLPHELCWLYLYFLAWSYFLETSFPVMFMEYMSFPPEQECDSENDGDEQAEKGQLPVTNTTTIRLQTIFLPDEFAAIFFWKERGVCATPGNKTRRNVLGSF